VCWGSGGGLQGSSAWPRDRSGSNDGSSGKTWSADGKYRWLGLAQGDEPVHVRLEYRALRLRPERLVYVGIYAAGRDIAHQVRSPAAERVDEQAGEHAAAPVASGNPGGRCLAASRKAVTTTSLKAGPFGMVAPHPGPATSL